MRSAQCQLRHRPRHLRRQRGLRLLCCRLDLWRPGTQRMRFGHVHAENLRPTGVRLRHRERWLRGCHRLRSLPSAPGLPCVQRCRQLCGRHGRHGRHRGKRWNRRSGRFWRNRRHRGNDLRPRGLLPSKQSRLRLALRRHLARAVRHRWQLQGSGRSTRVRSRGVHRRRLQRSLWHAVLGSMWNLPGMLLRGLLRQRRLQQQRLCRMRQRKHGFPFLRSWNVLSVGVPDAPLFG